jgi:hypothetical protein
VWANPEHATLHRLLYLSDEDKNIKTNSFRFSSLGLRHLSATSKQDGVISRSRKFHRFSSRVKLKLELRVAPPNYLRPFYQVRYPLYIYIIVISVFFFFLANFYSENEKIAMFRIFFPPFLEIKIFKLATSRPRHFLGSPLVAALF